MAQRRGANRRVDGRGELPALDERDTFRIAMAWRRGIEHGSSSDRRLAAQDDAVAAGGDDRRYEPELRPALPDPHDPGRHARGPDVDVEPRVVGDRLELVERDVEAERDGIRVLCDERLTARDLAALDARQADGDALARVRPRDVEIVNLDAAHTHRHARRLDAELVTRTDRARPERPGDD